MKSKLHQAVVAISEDEAIILWFRGDRIAAALNDGTTHADEVGLVYGSHGTPTPTKYGLWVWEGYFDYPNEDSFEAITTKCWREPTEDEWESIKKYQNPFRKKKTQ